MQKRLIFLSILLLIAGFFAGGASNSACFTADGARSCKEPVDYVDPMLGTSDSRWMMFPGPSMPFGMVKLSPDNEAKLGSDSAGYEYSIENISGFSHIHSWTMGGLLTMPTTGELKIIPGPQDDPDKDYRSRVSHDTETASAGYYAVTLADYGIKAELTSTTRAGFQRYTFPKADKARILFDLEIPMEYYYGGFEVLDARIQKVSDTEIEGYSAQGGMSGYGRGVKPWQEYTIYFVAKFSKPFESMGVWEAGKIYQNTNELSGSGDVGCFVNYSTSEGEVIKVKTGISTVSIAQARLNLETEMSKFGWDFDAVRKNARKTWNDLLSKIEVTGGTEADKIKFYTGLYRSYCGRSIWSDVNGKYVDMCEKVRQLEDPESPMLEGDSFWVSYWSVNNLWTLITPDIANQWVRSLLEMYDHGGWLSKGPAGLEYSDIMVASNEIALIVAAYQKGIRNYDIEKAYEAVRHIQTEQGRPHECGGYVGNHDLDTYKKLGYVPAINAPRVSPFKERISKTLDYAYDDWCVAQMAKALGKEEDYEYFMKRSENYKNIFDANVGYMRPKYADGTWVKDFNPYVVKTRDHAYFTEGNSWQFTFLVPHDIHGIVKLLGKERFNKRLNDGFEGSRQYKFRMPGHAYSHYDPKIPDYTVNMGNEPGVQAPYLFNYSQAPWLTQKWVREVMEIYYGLGPVDGYPSDEDQGKGGSWYVMSAIGLFEMQGGAAVKPIYEIGSPLFNKIVIHLDKEYYSGGKFIIEAKNNSKENVYIQSATLDGKPLNKPWSTNASRE